MKFPAIFLVSLIVATLAHPSVAQQKYNSKTNPKIEAKIKVFLSQMTLEEKVGMIHANSSFTSAGVERLGIPELIMSDGPHGVRPEHGRDWVLDEGVDDSGTYLPTGIILAATWNIDLGYQYGAVLGKEARFRGKDIILGPGVNIIRSPLNGRNFEYLSEDPFLTSKMAVGYIKGVQNQGVSACVKHFAANNEEADRGTVDVRMSERALREIYLPAFKAAVVDGKVHSVMGAYNKFRGQYATHNEYLVNKILKGEWGFKGVLLSDWGSVHDVKEALYNGTDLEMGTDLFLMNNSVSQSDASGKDLDKSYYDRFFMADSALNLVKNGDVPVSIIDDKVSRILRLMLSTNMIGGETRAIGTYNSPQHQKLALTVAEEGIVLLKNTPLAGQKNNVLPLSKSVKSIAVIGENATRENAMGGGSSQVRAKYEITPLQGLKNILGNSTNITYARGYKIDKSQKADDALIAEAVEAAKNAEVAIIYCGWTHGYDYSKWGDNAFDAEAVDKPNMKMPFEQDKLITAVLAANPNTIIVLIGGGAIDMNKWIAKTPAIIQGWYPGMEGGNALAKIIFGDVNPSGKLPVTFAKVLEDVPAHKLGEFGGTNGVVTYKDDVFVGYRYTQPSNVKPQFAFGHGLSYTNFTYNDAKVKAKKRSVRIKVTVKNTGETAGAEVVQIYVKKPGSIKLPEQELKSFNKVFLKAGESKKITFEIPIEDLRYFDELKNEWVLGKGNVKMMIGSASDDIKISKEVEL
jgi:beta-glucosidase